MLKKAVPYMVALGLLIITLVFFNIGYRTLVGYSDLTNRHNTVLNCFQNLSKQINNAAILNPDLANAGIVANRKNLFYADSLIIFQQLNLLGATARDTVNKQITSRLNTLVRSEIAWLLKSNVPDSIIHDKAREHIVAFQAINSLIDQGINRTTILIEYRRSQLNSEIRNVRVFIISFIILSGILLLYTTVKFFKQQEKTKKKEKELEIVLNRINDGVVSVDNNWRYTFLNNAAMATHPLGNEKTLGKVIWDVHPEMKGTIFWDKYHQAMETRTAVEIESYYPPMDIWFSVNVYPSDDGLTIFYKNITAIKKFQEQQALFASIVNSTDDAIVSMSIDGMVTSWNPGAEKLFKYTAEEIIGHRIGILVPAARKNEENKILEKISKGETIHQYETERVGKDGRGITISLTISPIMNTEGKIVGASGICRDVTQRKEAEERTRKSEKTYRAIASSIPGSVICLIDADYRFFLIEGDMVEKFGYSKSQLLGNRAADVLPPDIFDMVEKEYKRAFEGETITRESNRNGYDIIAKYLPLKDENNVVYAIMAVANDVTMLKNAQRDIVKLNQGLEEKIESRTEQLRRSNDDLEAFSYSVSHDLRAPLRGISGFASILQEDYGTKLDAEANRIMKVIIGNTIKMGQLIDDLLAFSHIGKRDIQKTRVDTKVMVSDIVNELADQNIGQPIVKWQIDQLPLINADTNTIRQVWINLLSNAVKYSRNIKQPCITIESTVRDGYNIFSIRDNGVGFDEKYRDKLFKVFQRLHTDREFEGTGVGLALTERIVSKHGGKVWAEGKLDEGACFYFSLPV
jgi:PAS domain S-box-containing protein